ncbi:hypothetical protein TSUD_335560 [Trifolium subterraneum]|uniref:Uncharacterized protein n=1 Tax=Trifolium subterraneum TaxID=3900 RepID=A0A2Z6LS24_TRISU|nr:hypothetical protein TSUD_335560 [Trifolium subterraneum]
MLFAKKRQRAVLRLVELPAAGYFLRGSAGEKEGPPYSSLLKLLYKARRERMDEQRFEAARPKQATATISQRKPWLIRADQNLDYQILDTIFLEMESPLPRLF